MQPFEPGAFKASGAAIATCVIHITTPEETSMPVTETTRKPARKASATSARPTPDAGKAVAELRGTPTLPAASAQPNECVNGWVRTERHPRVG